MSERELFSLEGKVLPFRRPSAAVRVRRRNPWLALAPSRGRWPSSGRPRVLAAGLYRRPVALRASPATATSSPGGSADAGAARGEIFRRSPTSSGARGAPLMAG
jgi:hypothetical protein